MIAMTLCALAAALLYGTGAALEQRQAARAPRAAAGRPRLLGLLARQPLWLLGLAAQAGGFAAHAAALRFGPLGAVQVLTSGELVVAVLVLRLWSGRPLRRGAWMAALTVVAGSASFLLLTAPSASGQAGALAGPGGQVPAAVAAALAGVAAVAAAVAGLRAAGRRRAVLLAVAAGLADACAAVVTMAFSHTLSLGPAALATSWTGYALAVCGAGDVLLTQTAYQAGRPLVTLPVISAVTPLASVAVAVGLLGERPGHGVAGLAAAAAVAVITGLALAWLARCAPAPEPAPARESAPAREPVTAAVPSPSPEPSVPPAGRRVPALTRA